MTLLHAYTAEIEIGLLMGEIEFHFDVDDMGADEHGIDCNAVLSHFRLGSKAFDRTDLIEMTSKADVLRLESEAAEDWAAQAGDRAAYWADDQRDWAAE